MEMPAEAVLERDVLPVQPRPSPAEPESGRDGATDRETVDRLLAGREAMAHDLIDLLHELQAELGYLREGALRLLAQRLSVPLIEVYRVASFFRAFTLKPRGRHVINVCMGTACHVRGAGRIVEAIRDQIGVGPGETSDDLEYTVETVNCLGACAMGPVVVLDGKYHDHVSLPRLRPLLSSVGAPVR